MPLTTVSLNFLLVSVILLNWYHTNWKCFWNCLLLRCFRCFRIEENYPCKRRAWFLCQ